MISGFFRFVAIVLLVLAFLFLGGDIITSLEKGGIVMRSFTESLALLGAGPMPWIEETLPSALAGVVETVMDWPGWATLGVAGLVVGALSWGRSESDYDGDDMGGFSDSGDGD
jgi:hypothetical protein